MGSVKPFSAGVYMPRARVSYANHNTVGLIKLDQPFSYAHLAARAFLLRMTIRKAVSAPRSSRSARVARKLHPLDCHLTVCVLSVHLSGLSGAQGTPAAASCSTSCCDITRWDCKSLLDQ